MKKLTSFLHYFAIPLRIVPLTVLLIVATSLAGLYLRHEKNLQIELYLDAKNQMMQAMWRSIVGSHQSEMAAYYNALIETPEVINLMRDAQDPQKIDQARQQLYQSLLPRYNLLKRQNIRQLHFHTADIKSLLRFHAPEHYGDSLVESRPSIVKANQERMIVQEFETGKVISGFRTIFPVMDQGNLLGTVEVAQPFSAFESQLERFAGSAGEPLMVIKASAIKSKLFEEQKHLYTSTPFSNEWLIEDMHRTEADGGHKIGNALMDLLERLKDNPYFLRKLEHGSPTAMIVSNGEHPLCVMIQPIKDVNGNLAANVLMFTAAPEVETIQRNFWFQLGAMASGSLIVWLIVIALLRSQKRLSDEKIRLNMITDTMGEGMYVMDTVGVVTRANQSACKMLGYTPEDLLGEVAHKLFHAHIGNGYTTLDACPICQSMTGNTHFEGEEIFKRSDGTLFAADVICEPLVDNGNVIGAVILFRDASIRKQYERQLESFNTALKQQVETEIAKRQEAEYAREQQMSLMIQQAKMAELGTMVGAIVHQWKQPLNAISIITQVIEDRYDLGDLTHEEFAQLSEKIQKQIVFMSATMESFKNFYKPSMEHEPFSVIQALETLLSLIGGVLDNDMIEVTLSGDRSVIVDGFPNELKQVILNLINNSSDAFKERQIEKRHIMIDLSEEEEMAILTVCDNAGGIPIDLLPTKIFEPFVSTKGALGTGIGLSLSKTIIVEKFHGTMSVDNTYDGCCFTIAMPCQWVADTAKV